MDELQGERKDPAQDLSNGLLVSSADVDSFEIINNPKPITNGMYVCNSYIMYTKDVSGLNCSALMHRGFNCIHHVI